jgi:hypothetical protein
MKLSTAHIKQIPSDPSQELDVATYLGNFAIFELCIWCIAAATGALPPNMPKTKVLHVSLTWIFVPSSSPGVNITPDCMQTCANWDCDAGIVARRTEHVH